MREPLLMHAYCTRCFFICAVTAVCKCLKETTRDGMNNMEPYRQSLYPRLNFPLLPRKMFRYSSVFTLPLRLVQLQNPWLYHAVNIYAEN